MKAYENWKFSIMFFWLLAIVLLSSFTETNFWARFALILSNSFFFLAAILSMAQDHHQRTMAFCLGILTILGKWLDLCFVWQRGFPIEIVDRAISSLFLVFVITTCLSAIFKKDQVTNDSLMGAFSGYILLGLAWGFILSIVELVYPGSYRISDYLLNGSNNQTIVKIDRILIYFSFCTLITIGYGDITPVLPLAQALSIIEAITGQIYIAVLVAILVAVKVSQKFSTSTPDNPIKTP